MYLSFCLFLQVIKKEVSTDGVTLNSTQQASFYDLDPRFPIRVYCTGQGMNKYFFFFCVLS